MEAPGRQNTLVAGNRVTDSVIGVGKGVRCKGFPASKTMLAGNSGQVEKGDQVDTTEHAEPSMDVPKTVKLASQARNGQS